MFKKGQAVTAAGRVVETNFSDKKRHVHAERGEPGVVVEVADVGPDEDGNSVWLVSVRWARTGTVSSCFDDEIRAAGRATQAA